MSLAANLDFRVRQGTPLSDAAREIMTTDLEGVAGYGGLIALSQAGETAIEFNTEIMFRAWRTGGSAGVAAGAQELDAGQIHPR